MQDATPQPPCPSCGATHVVRNGSNQSGTPTFLCRGCGRRFVVDPKAGPVPAEKEALVRRLLGERLSLRAIARTAQVSRSWLQGHRPAAGDVQGAIARTAQVSRSWLQEFVNALYWDDSRWQADPPPRSKKSGRW